VKVWLVSDGSLLADLSGSGQWVTGLHFSPDGMSLAGSDMDGKVYVWQLSDRKKINEIPVSAMGESSMIAFAPDGRLLAVTEKERVWFYHLDEKQPYQQLPVLAADVTALRISPDSQWLACALADGTIQVWQVPQGVLLETIQSGMSTVSNLDFSKDGKTLLAASRDGTVRFWEIQNIGSKR
jgi:WD40 repeat protein